MSGTPVPGPHPLGTSNGLSPNPAKESTVTRTFRMWLPAVSVGVAPRLLLGVASVATFGVIAFGPTTAAHAAEPGAPAAPAAAPAAPAQAAANLMLPHLTALQPNYYYCGPAATRAALSAHGDIPSFDQLAAELGTTTNGTSSANETTRVLNAHLGAGRYHTVEISGQKASAEQIEQLRKDVVTAGSRGDAVVANVAGRVTDTAGDVHSFPGGHFIAVIAYSDEGRTVRIADSWDFEGTPEYDLPVGTLANWIATRGYSA